MTEAKKAELLRLEAEALLQDREASRNAKVRSKETEAVAKALKQALDMYALSVAMVQEIETAKATEEDLVLKKAEEEAKQNKILKLNERSTAEYTYQHRRKLQGDIVADEIAVEKCKQSARMTAIAAARMRSK